MYHLVWLPKYRKRILEGSVERRLKELFFECAEINGWEILELNIQRDHVHMIVQLKQTISVSQAVQRFKGGSSKIIREEFPELKKLSQSGNFWAKGYLVVSGSNPPPAEFLDDFIQKNRRPSGIMGK